MEPRIGNPAMVLPDAMKALHALNKATENAGVPQSTIGLVQLRASQINGCSVCCDQHPRYLKQAGESDDRINAVAAWRDTPYFTEEERAALALAEYVTRLADVPDPVPDAIWEDAAKYYDEQGLAALLLAISTINVWNRLNVATKQQAGAKW
ncbi:MAG TPA: carboxymuconolactone decarboxylase family protein [Actinophytocola sp.]|uniref:carboxymuconolactone decarboxylase family protein n=1 Tax=Actinophytocola sp. TaxID=1872138 RepID=UPI002DDCCEDA|nr:carboxymuconolactone decarboxylase family protein [Actinophytocola sp.]HEV2780544.1 carboxymuconolactone decarboxylase family protein [Actinophytocola sp.]